MELEIIRHLSIFNPNRKKIQLNIVGTGASGSKLTLELAKLGISDISVWDFDKVESHNIPNQAFFQRDIGVNKAFAIKNIVKGATNIDIKAYDKEFATKEIEGIICVLTDTMVSRKNIWDNYVKYNPLIDLMVETRMGPKSFMIYMIDPNNINQVKAYEKTFYSDEESDVSACGTRVSVGPTSSALASFTAWQLIKWANDEPYENELIVSLSPFSFISRNF